MVGGLPGTKECLLPTKFDGCLFSSLLGQSSFSRISVVFSMNKISVLVGRLCTKIGGGVYLGRSIYPAWIGGHFIGYLSHPSRMGEIKGSILSIDIS